MKPNDRPKWIAIQEDLLRWCEEEPEQERSYSLLRCGSDCGDLGWKVVLMFSHGGETHKLGFSWCEAHDRLEEVARALKGLREQLRIQVLRKPPQPRVVDRESN
jgi:hypothetical protein